MRVLGLRLLPPVGSRRGVFPRETPGAVLCGGVGASAAIVGVLHPLNSSVELWLSGCFSEGESCERQRELSPFLGSQMADGLGAEQCLGAPLPVAAFPPSRCAPRSREGLAALI